jgi:hypothetical protein
MRTQKFTVVAIDPTNDNKPFTSTFYAPTLKGAEYEANLLFGTQNVQSVKPDLTPCDFDLWYNGKLPNMGSFSTKLYDLYMIADSGNRERLEIAFPEDFVGSTF